MDINPVVVFTLISLVVVLWFIVRTYMDNSRVETKSKKLDQSIKSIHSCITDIIDKQ